VAYQINCECGYTASGETEDELIQDAEQHIQDVHPDLAGKVSREELLAQAKEV